MSRKIELSAILQVAFFLVNKDGPTRPTPGAGMRGQPIALPSSATLSPQRPVTAATWN